MKSASIFEFLPTWLLLRPTAFLTLPANFSLPEKCDYMDEVTYGELEKEEAQPIVTKYKEEARKLLPPSEKRTNRRNNRNKRNRQNRSRGQSYGECWGLTVPQVSLFFVLCRAGSTWKPSHITSKSGTASLELLSPVCLYLYRWCVCLAAK